MLSTTSNSRLWSVLNKHDQLNNEQIALRDGHCLSPMLKPEHDVMCLKSQHWEGRHRVIFRACCLVNLVKLVSFMVSERVLASKNRAQQQRKTPSINLWPPHASTHRDIQTHTNMYTCLHHTYRSGKWIRRKKKEDSVDS